VLHLKGLEARGVYEKVMGGDGRSLKSKQRGEILRLAMLAQDEHASLHAQLEGLLGGGAWFAGQLPRRAGQESCRFDEIIIAYRYRMSMITCKWFGC
jgi:hypothetical protein